MVRGKAMPLVLSRSCLRRPHRHGTTHDICSITPTHSRGQYHVHHRRNAAPTSPSSGHVHLAHGVGRGWHAFLCGRPGTTVVCECVQLVCRLRHGGPTVAGIDRGAVAHAVVLVLRDADCSRERGVARAVRLLRGCTALALSGAAGDPRRGNTVLASFAVRDNRFDYQHPVGDARGMSVRRAASGRTTSSDRGAVTHRRARPPLEPALCAVRPDCDLACVASLRATHITCSVARPHGLWRGRSCPTPPVPLRAARAIVAPVARLGAARHRSSLQHEGLDRVLLRGARDARRMGCVRLPDRDRFGGRDPGADRVEALACESYVARRDRELGGSKRGDLLRLHLAAFEHHRRHDGETGRGIQLRQFALSSCSRACSC